jgi:tetratricopeptide (TPR) repeat protein
LIRPSSRYLAAVVCLWQLCLAGCSIEQNSATSNAYHNVTAHFNGYFYALEETKAVEALVLKSLDDDHNQILKLFPKLDTVLAKSYAKNTEEIIKMASLSIQRHPNSKWVDDNYLLVGLARMYSCDFQNAVVTFKFVNSNSKDRDTRHAGLIHLIRTFTEQNEYDKAEEAFLYLDKENLNALNKKNLHLEKANYYQVRNDYDNMVRNLASADPLLTKSDRKARIYFIIGQVYQQLGFTGSAYDYYLKCLATNPEYEIDFYARLNMAQVARLDNAKAIRTIRNQFTTMLHDTKNQEFQDKIYFELGEFERKQGNLTEAIDNYSLAAHAGTNARIKGGSYLRIGQVYFDSIRKYSLAKAYYDSTVATLPKEHNDYATIKKRQEVLGEFVTYSETITWQDSLLSLASLDTAAVRMKLDSALAKKALADAEPAKKKKKRAPVQSNSNQDNPFFQNESTSTTDWYFGNLAAVSLGESEFQRIWGSRPLEDNWRRANKMAVTTATPDTTRIAQTNSTDADNAPTKKTDEVAKLIKQLPVTEKQKQEAFNKIEEAYFKLADIYNFQLGEKDNASTSYQKLLTRFPQSAHAPEVLYKLYLISKEKNDGMATTYSQRLINDYPTSTFARILINPDYLKETSITAEKQKTIYKDAYADYQRGDLRAAQEKISQALKLGDTGFVPNLKLLNTLITGKTEEIARYQLELNEFIKTYPENTLVPYAESLLASSKTFLLNEEKAKGIRFMNMLEGPHRFVMIYLRDEKTKADVSGAVEAFNNRIFKNEKLTITNVIFNETYMVTYVSEFPDRATSMGYLAKFIAQSPQDNRLANYKFDTFVITPENFDIFYRTKALNEYLTFFDRNYKKENQ